MRKFIAVLFSGVALTILTFSGANAATFQIVGGTGFELNSFFDPAGWNDPNIHKGTIIQTFNSANAETGGLEINPSITGGAAVTLSFTYLGFEAAYTNVSEASFSYNSADPMFINKSTPINTPSGALAFNLTSPGYIPFLFASWTYGADGVAINHGPIGSNVELGLLIDSSNSSTAYAFFKDIAANCPGTACSGDQDFDDMVVKIQILSSSNIETTTPLPATLPLFVSGLGALGLFGWRRKRKNAAASAD